MRLGKCLKCLFVITVIALIYLHMQMKIFSLAYNGKQKENAIVQLKEMNTRVSYDILEIKSARYLGQTLFSKEKALKFCDRSSVVTLKGSEEGTKQAKAHKRLPKGLWERLLSWRPQAEAEAHERTDRKPWQRASY